MRTSRLILFAAATLMAGVVGTHAGTPFLHNGSITEAGYNSAGQFLVTYTIPKPGLQAIGIVSGTLLVTGSVNRGVFNGIAYRFRRGCAPLPYAVQGAVSLSGTFVLNGISAQYGNGCQQGGWDYLNEDGQNDLVFNYAGNPAPSAAPSRRMPGMPGMPLE